MLLPPWNKPILNLAEAFDKAGGWCGCHSAPSWMITAMIPSEHNHGDGTVSFEYNSMSKLVGLQQHFTDRIAEN